MARQRRLQGQQVPKPIVTIHNHIDTKERAIAKRKELKEKIDDCNAAIGRLLKKNKAILDTGPKGSIVYKRLGYFAEVHADEKVTTKLTLPPNEREQRR